MVFGNDLKNILKYWFFSYVFDLYHGIKMFKSKGSDIFDKHIKFVHSA